MENSTVLRSYNKIKNFETKIYRLGNTLIPIPIPITTSLYFIGALIIVALIDSLINININPIYKYVALPLLMAYIAKNRNIDGKPAHKYIIRLLQFQLIKNSKIERFKIRKEIKPFEFK